jgi:hypothetical protein
MADVTTISALATGAGTMVLAVATFSAVRSSNRSARTAERTLLAALRPFLINGRINDPIDKIMWSDQHWSSVGEGRAAVENSDDAVYLAMPLRNAGSGLAVLHGWNLVADWDQARDHAKPEVHRRQTRDLYIAAGDTGFWQGAVREENLELKAELRATIAARDMFQIDLLYSDSEGGQHTISRFAVMPKGDEAWVCSVTRHWNLDRADPR